MLAPIGLLSTLLLVNVAFAYQPGGSSDFQSEVAKRQVTGQVPSPCQAVCPISQTPECEPIPDCLCNDDHNQRTVTCYDCLVANNSTDPDLANTFQIAVNGFEQRCNGLGLTVKSLTVSSANPTGSPTGSGSTPASASSSSTSGIGPSSTSTGGVTTQFVRVGWVAAIISGIGGAILL